MTGKHKYPENTHDLSSHILKTTQARVVHTTTSHWAISHKHYWCVLSISTEQSPKYKSMNCTPLSHAYLYAAISENQLASRHSCNHSLAHMHHHSPSSTLHISYSPWCNSYCCCTKMPISKTKSLDHSTNHSISLTSPLCHYSTRQHTSNPTTQETF